MTMQPTQIDLSSSCYFGGDGLACLLGDITSALGGTGLFGLLLGAFLFIGLYIASDGDLATPTVALVLTGTVTVSMVPDPYGQIAYGVVVIGFAAAVWQGFQKYILRGVTQ